MGLGVPQTEGEGRHKPTYRLPRGVGPRGGAVASSRARGRVDPTPFSLWFACAPWAGIPSAQLPCLIRSRLPRHAAFNAASMHVRPLRDPYSKVGLDSWKLSTVKEEWHGRPPVPLGMMGRGPCRGKARMASHVRRTRHTLITCKGCFPFPRS